MKIALFVVGALSVAHCSLTTPRFDLFGPRMFMKNNEDSTMMRTSGLCRTLCKRQMIGTMDSDTISKDDMDMIHQQMMEKMDEIMQQYSTVMPVEQNTMEMAEQLTQTYRQFTQIRMNMYINEMRKSENMIMSVPSRLQYIVKQQAVEILSEIFTKIDREDPERMKQLEDVLIAAITSQMVLQESGLVMNKDFSNQVLEMMQSSDILKTQRILAETAMRATEVQMKMKLLEQQKRMLQMVMMMKTPLGSQVEIGQEKLLKTIEELTISQLSFQMVMNTLQRALMSQRDMMQKLKIDQLDFQPMMMMSKMMMPQMMQV